MNEREAFESWAGEYWEIQYFRRGPDGSARQGEYLDHGLFDAWQAWQSRAALAQPEPVAKVYERADGSFGIHKLGELHGGMMLYAGHAQPATDLAHELWAMAQSPGPISEVCALMAKRLAQPQPEAQPEPVERWSCPRCGSPRRAHVCHAQEPKRAC